MYLNVKYVYNRKQGKHGLKKQAPESPERYDLNTYNIKMLN